MKSANQRHIIQPLLIALLFMLPVNLRGADIQYESGWLINLATIRGTQATASDNLRKDHPPASFLLHPGEGEIRFDNNFGPCWWMMELPGSYEVSDVRLNFRDVINSVGFQIRIAQEPPDNWAQVPVVGSFSGTLAMASNGRRVAWLHFDPVEARFIRIEFRGHNGGEYGAGSGHQDLVVDGLQVWGPNNPAVSPAISLAQSAWAGATCTFHDCTTDAIAPDGSVQPHPPIDCPSAVDDNDPAASDGVNAITTYFTPGSSGGIVQQIHQPATFVVTLKNRARIVAVGYSGPTADRVERPRDMKIYTSPLAMGADWTLQKTLTDMYGGAFQEIELDQSVIAQRVRFDIEKVWNHKIDPQRKNAEGHLSQLYVYGQAVPPDIEFTSPSVCQASCEIFDARGEIVRVLQLPRTVRPGTYGICWDGLNDLGEAMPSGQYEARIVLNPVIYSNIGVIGNTAMPPTIDQNPTQIDSVAVDANGNIYTADFWDEAAQDFRKWDRDTGRHVFDAHGLIRSGNPNGLAYAIGVDDKFIYCATTSHTNHAQQHLRRFRLSDGAPAPFPASESDGHILLHDRPDEEIPPEASQPIIDEMKLPLHAIASVQGKVFVADALAGKILSFDRETGAPLDSFSANIPIAMAADSSGRLWVGLDNGVISVFTPDGKLCRVMAPSIGHIGAMAFGPGDTLYVADTTAQNIWIRCSDGSTHTFGQRAAPGDYAPDHFYSVTGIAVDRGGNLTVAQKLPVDGARLTRFSPDGTVIWDQLGGEFCNTGNISAERPDELITQNLHRYVVDKQSGTSQFRGSVLDGDPRYIHWQHGAMRIQKLGAIEFIFQGYGDGLQVYRREGDLYRLCSMFGSANPFPDGSFRDEMEVPDEQKPAKRLWSWHDSNGNGKVDDDEIDWATPPEFPVDWDNFGVSIDKQGNALLCEFNNSITEIPMTGFDARGNPIYDMSKRRIIVPPDRSAKPLLSDPIMAARDDDGGLYVMSRSKVFPAPPDSGAWMAGWMLARYDKNGRRLWFTPLSQPCPGMDVVPGGGVMLASMKWDTQGCDIYHYSRDGALIGIIHPARQFLGAGGIPDNTGSLSISRDPRDGLLDIFVEDCVGNRFYWYRADDRKTATIRTIRLLLTSPGSALHTITASSSTP
jgi:hypothetical protein